MKKQTITIAVVFVGAFFAVAYISHHQLSRSSENVATDLSATLNAESNPKASSAQQEYPPPPPPPPPFPSNAPVRESPPEPTRTLRGVASEDLKQIEQYLPQGAQIYTYPVGESDLAAAIVSGDLDNDGKVETVVVYNERRAKPDEISSPLTLGILSVNGKTLTVRSSVKLSGGLFFNPWIEGIGTPLAIQDVTGDGNPEILVVSGGGASVGGAMQVFSFNGNSLNEIGHFGGHFFNVRSKGSYKSIQITARWNGEKGARIFQWNGQVFEQISH